MSTGMSRNSNTTIDEVWEDLQLGLTNVYNRSPMTPARYMELYTHVFNFCTSLGVVSAPSRSAQRGRRSGAAETQNSSDFMGVDLYNRLRDFVRAYVVNVYENGKDLNDEDLLRYYTREWEEFRFSSKVVDGIFAYLNRHWIKREMDEGNDNIYTIYTLALVVWRDDLFTAMRDRVTGAVLDLIQRERKGETIPNQLIKGVVNSHVELGVENEREPEAASRAAQPAESTNLKVYREQFETAFLAATQNFYAKEAQEFNQQNPLTEYMKKVEIRLNEEQERCSLYLHQSTQGKLAKCLEKVLIESQLEAFQGEFGKLLESRQDDDLARMYKLCERVEEGLGNLRSALEQHITKEGLAAVEQVADTAATDAKLYVTTVLGVHTRYAALVEQAFRNEPGFNQSLDKAATTFINKNAVTLKAGAQNTNKSPELLAKYCDQLLRKSSKMPEDTELEAMLTQVMVVFKYVDDKDVFSKFYTKMFSKRLIHEVSASEDAEMSLINKLKQSCGFEYTNRMAKMINDVQISKETCSGFRSHMAEKSTGNSKELDLNILILSTGSWPNMQPTSFLLPERLTSCIENFKAYYDSKHNGRKLTWVLSQSRGEIVSTAFNGKKIFICTTAQMALLMLYNEALEYTADNLFTALQMDKKTLALTISSLVKTEVLKGGDADATSGEYPAESVISLNSSFTSKKFKVDLSKAVLRADVKQEGEQVQRNVDEDRKSVISACIVRIMKTRKSLPHQQLMTEVLSQLTVRFKPKPDLVKRCIGQLIEKEYLRRSEEKRDIYEYIS